MAGHVKAFVSNYDLFSDFSKLLNSGGNMMLFNVALMVAAGFSAPTDEPARLPTLIIDSRFTGCDFEEQKYYVRGKAERRAEKVKAVLRAEQVEFREIRWTKDSDVPDAAGIKSLAPMKYFRNC